MADWLKTKDGDFLVHGLTGYAAMISSEMTVMIRLDYLRPEDARNAPTGNLQLAMKPQHARELAAALLGMADQIETPPAGKPS